MKRMTFQEFADGYESYYDYDVHIIVVPFGDQILCNFKDFPRAYKVATLNGSSPRAVSRNIKMPELLGVTSMSLDKLNNLLKEKKLI